MTHFTKLFQFSLVKSLVVASALFTSSLVAADDSQALQLAQTSDGFNVTSTGPLRVKTKNRFSRKNQILLVVTIGISGWLPRRISGPKRA